MSQLQKYSDSSPEDVSLEDLLINLLTYGKPRVSKQEPGWVCFVEMNTDAIGAMFEIRSDFKHKTPKEAVLVCLDRVQKAIAIYKDKP